MPYFPKKLKNFLFQQNFLFSKPTSGQVYCILGKAGEKIPPQVPKFFVRSRRISLNFFWKRFFSNFSFLTPKMHFWKTCRTNFNINPKFFHCYSENDTKKNLWLKMFFSPHRRQFWRNCRKSWEKGRTFSPQCPSLMKVFLRTIKFFPQNNLVAI